MSLPSIFATSPDNSFAANNIKLFPVLPACDAQPIIGNTDPKINITLNEKPLQILVDSGAHVSVLPKTLVQELTGSSLNTAVVKSVRAFGGHNIQLQGPVELIVDLCGLTFTFPFYYVDAAVPSILGYDLMVHAQLVLDVPRQVVYSRHPNACLHRYLVDLAAPCTDGGPVLSNLSAPMVATPHVVSPLDVTTDISSASETSPKARFPRLDPPSPPSGAPVTPVIDSINYLQVPRHVQSLYDATVARANLSYAVDEQFRQLLTDHTDTFAVNGTDLGFCPVLQLDIDTGDAAPIKQSPRRPPLSAGDAEAKILQEMLDADVVEPSISPWASPVCLVKKPDGTYRFCIDYRRVNAVSRKDAYPVPDIHDAFDSLRGARYFATLDLLSGYWQLGMTERAKERSAFCTRSGLFQFKRMPFGLSGAPSTFCRLMQIVLAGLLWSICLCYIDDIIIYANSPEQLLQRLDQVLSRLAENGLKVKGDKCILFRQEIPFLGHIVSADGIQPQPEKLQAIRDWQTPHCVTDVRAFYGLASYYRRFIAGFATIAEPLTRLTRKGTRFVWTPEAQEAFENLKEALQHTPILAYPIPNQTCIVDTDASEVAISGVLSQVVDGVERPIAFFSRVMSPAQRNYCATRRELLAVVAALQYYRHYLLYTHVLLRTDHHSLKWLNTFKRPEGILARWVETLAEFHYTIEHRPGKQHCNADGISRPACKQCWGKLAKLPWVDELSRADELTEPLALHTLQLLPELSTEDLADLQVQDSALAPLRDLLTRADPPSLDDLRALPQDARKLWAQRANLEFREHVLIRAAEDHPQFVVPEILRQRLFIQAHSGPLSAHLGAERTLAILSRHYHWPGIRRDVTSWCQACAVCATSRPPPARYHGRMKSVSAAAPMDLVSIDILSGLPLATDGSKCLLVAVDHMTKWVEAFPLPNEEASTCMQALYAGFFSRFGLPAQLHSDQGRNFESRLVAELTQLAGIRRTRTTPFHPRSDGITERMNRTILTMLRATAHDNPLIWPEALPAILAAYRMTPHSSTGVSPNMAMLGREVLCPCTLIAAPPDDPISKLTPFNQNFQTQIRNAHNRVRQATRISARTQKNYFDKHIKAPTFSVGQLVWLYWPQPKVRQRLRKLTRVWVGPFQILSFVSDVVVKIQHIRQRKMQTVHVDRLAPCNGPSPLPLASLPQNSVPPVTPVINPPVVEHQQPPPVTSPQPDVPGPRRSYRQRRPPSRYL